MTNIELTQITQLLHTDPNKFYTDLSAHKLGFDTQHSYIFNVYLNNNNKLLEHISQFHPNLLKQYVKYEGKLTKKLNNIEVFYNYELYDDIIIKEDLKPDKMHLYVKILNHLSVDLQNLFYSMINLQNYTLILNYDLIIPINLLKDEYLVMYINYMKNNNNFEDFLVDLNRGVFLLDNYHLLACESVDKYILKNITIINETSIKSLLSKGMKIQSILKYKPQSLLYLVDYVTTLRDFKAVLSVINLDTDISIIDKIITKFPLYKNIIDNTLRAVLVQHK